MRQTLSIALTTSLLCLLFLFNGLFGTVNDVLKPLLREDFFSLSYTEAALIHFSFYLASLFVPVPASHLVSRVGYRRAILPGLGFMLLGSILFIMAGSIGRFWVFLVGIFTTAVGTTIIGTTVNPYTTLIGDPQRATARLSLVNASYMLGGILGPILGTKLLHGRLDQVEIPTTVVYLPYMAMAVLIGLVILTLWLIRIPEPKSAIPQLNESLDPHPLRYPHFRFGWVALFFYGGAEIATGSLLVDYLGLEQTTQLPREIAGIWVSVYWGGYMIGRLMGGTVLSRFDARHLLRACAVSSIALLGLVIWGRGWWASGAVIALGVTQSVIFPTLFRLTIRGLGNRTQMASGIFVMGIVGGGILAIVQGNLADMPALGVQRSFILTLLGHLYILSVVLFVFNKPVHTPTSS